jgi:hypothetical protein
MVPALARVGALVDAAAGPAQVEGEGDPHLVVGGGVQDPGVHGVHGHVHHADVLPVHHRPQDLLPTPATVGGPVKAPLLVLGVEGTQGRHVDDIRVLGVDHHPSDVVGLGKAHVGPGHTCVRGLVDAVPPIGAPGVVGLPGPEVEDVRIRGRHGDGADGVDVLVGSKRVSKVMPWFSDFHRCPDPAAM